MPLWGSKDDAANSVISATMQYNLATNSTNRTNLYGNTTANVIVQGAIVGQFAADVNEVAADKRIPHAGWVLKKEGTGGRAGRVTYEVLVAGGSIGNPDGDAAALVNYTILVGTQPSSVSASAGNTASFSVVASSRPAGATLGYQWQVNAGAGWSNVTDAGVYSGATTATLSISDVTGLNGRQYRAAVSEANSTTVNSSAATLTVV